jgi:signal transduction histidine kinase
MEIILLILVLAAVGLSAAGLQAQQGLKKQLELLSRQPAADSTPSEDASHNLKQLQADLTAAQDQIREQAAELKKLRESEQAVADANVKMTELYMELEDKTTELEDRNAELQALNQQLNETREQLVQSEKMAALGQLVAGVAHEINTPIGVSVTAASHIEKTCKELTEMVESGQIKRSVMVRLTENLRESSQLILHNLHRASDLIQSFKKVAVEQGQSDVVRFRLDEFLQEVMTSLSPEFRKTALTYEVQGPSGLEMVSVPSALSQIVINFVMNSLKHGFTDHSQPGQMKLSYELIGGGRIRLTYSDTGKGIPEDVLPRIWDPFFTTKRGEGGSGLGLHIVYNIVTQQLRGTIRCESQLGQGTTFILEMPVILHEAEPSRQN